jgi:phosphomannomutase/phosphoglucomutase|tara:strand:+ start:12328 stop:14814 length:2487 start_codon:yes stop_codon:yes gene_type:complete
MAKKTGGTNFGLIPLASVGTGFVLAILLILFVVRAGITSDHRATVADIHADSLQQQLNIQLAQIKLQLSSMATSIHLANVVTDADASARSLEETALASMIPHALRVRLFAPGKAEVDRDAIPPFSFTSLDLVNRAESGTDVNPEAVNSSGRWTISLATPIRIPSDDKVQGTLFVYLDIKAIADQVQQNVEGELRLMQSVGSAQPTEILLLGTGRSPDAETLERTLDNPNWTLLYTPSQEVQGQTVGNFIVSLIPAIVFFVIALGGVFVGTTKFSSLLKSDLSHLDHQIASVASGLYTPSDKYNIGAFSEVDLSLLRLGKKDEARGPVPKLKVTEVGPAETMEDLVDIEMLDEDSYAEATSDSSDLDASGDEGGQAFSSIFRAYDIRGIVNESLTPELIHKIGQAIGTEAEALGQQTILVGADGRISSPDVRDELIAGLLASGRDVIDIGLVPTPMLYFATHNSDTQSGVMVTGSHNPPDYNGFKVVLDGRALLDEDIQKLYQRVVRNDFFSGKGERTEIDIREDYIDAITDDVVVAQPLTVVVDCCNGIAGEIAPDLLENLGCDVVPLYCEVDGTFPNHPPDPTEPGNLDALVQEVQSQNADIGIAFDGDGDRLVAVTKHGEIVWPDRLLMLFAKDVVSRNPGSDVVYDVKCTRHLNGVISGFGGRPIICRSGHSFVKEKIAETDAVLGGEMSGHICFSERWFGFDDGLYSAARLLEIVGSQTEGLDELLSEFPSSHATPEIRIEVGDETKFEIMDQLNQVASFDDGTVTTIDGIRVDYADGWGLVRASNTNPMLTLRFEADDDSAMERIKNVFREQIQAIDENINFD